MLSRTTRLASFGACLPLFFLFGCKARESGTTDTTAATTTGGETTSAAATAPANKWTDANVVALFDEANIADSSAGAAAEKKATNADVKAFAKMMVGEHHALRVKGQELAKKPSGALPPWPKAEPPANDPFKSAVDDEKSALESAPKGAAFDSTYIAHEIAIHQAVLDWATSAQPQVQNADLKGLIESSGPVIKKHLDRAKEIEQKLASSPGTATKKKAGT
jgi:putative membrane protein